MKYKVGDILSVRERRTMNPEAATVEEYFSIIRICKNKYIVKRHSGGNWYNFHGKQKVSWAAQSVDDDLYMDIDIIGVNHRKNNILKLMRYING